MEVGEKVVSRYGQSGTVEKLFPTFTVIQGDRMKLTLLKRDVISLRKVSTPGLKLRVTPEALFQAKDKVTRFKKQGNPI